MSDAASTAGGGGATSGGASSPGALLKAAREQQGLHIAALAAAIKVTPRKLDALENDRWSELPDATFARALAQTVCRTLKIDARPILAMLPAAGSTTIEPTSRTAHTPFRERSGRDAPSFASSAIRPMVWAAMLLMVAAVVIYFVPDSVWRPAPAPAMSDAPPQASPAASVPPASFGESTPPAATAATSGTADPAATTVSAAAPASDAPTVVAAAPAAGSTIQLKVSKPSWIRARAADGSILLSRSVEPGETVALDGALPIQLTIGNAAATQVTFRGQPVDLGPSLRGNVARLVLE